MQQELFDNLETELQKALRDDKHKLSEAINELVSSMRNYQDECTEAFKAHDELIEHVGVLQRTNDDMLTFIKDLYLILNAEKETAEKIKGMSDIMQAMARIIVSPAAIKHGAVKNAKS